MNEMMRWLKLAAAAPSSPIWFRSNHSTSSALQHLIDKLALILQRAVLSESRRPNVKGIAIPLTFLSHYSGLGTAPAVPPCILIQHFNAALHPSLFQHYMSQHLSSTYPGTI